MRALLDENLPHKLRSYFEDNVDVVTVSHKRSERKREWRTVETCRG